MQLSLARKPKLLEAPPAAATSDGGGSGPLTKGEIRKFKKLATMIKDDTHLQAILQTAIFDQREILYNQIAPWLSFKARPFDELRFF